MKEKLHSLQEGNLHKEGLLPNLQGGKVSKAWSEHMTGLVGWWRRYKSDLERTEKEFKKTEMEKSVEIQRRNLEKHSKTSAETCCIQE